MTWLSQSTVFVGVQRERFLRYIANRHGRELGFDEAMVWAIVYYRLCTARVALSSGAATWWCWNEQSGLEHGNTTFSDSGYPCRMASPVATTDPVLWDEISNGDDKIMCYGAVWSGPYAKFRISANPKTCSTLYQERSIDVGFMQVLHTIYKENLSINNIDDWSRPFREQVERFVTFSSKGDPDMNLQLQEGVDNFFASLLRFPGHVMQFLLAFVGARGCGKDAILSVLAKLIGPGNVHVVGGGKAKPDHFNANRLEALLCLWEEVVLDKRNKEAEAYLKDAVTTKLATSNRKHTAKRIVRTHTNNIMTSQSLEDLSGMKPGAQGFRRFLLVRWDGDVTADMVKEVAEIWKFEKVFIYRMTLAAYYYFLVMPPRKFSFTNPVKTQPLLELEARASGLDSEVEQFICGYWRSQSAANISRIRGIHHVLDGIGGLERLVRREKIPIWRNRPYPKTAFTWRGDNPRCVQLLRQQVAEANPAVWHWTDIWKLPPDMLPDCDYITFLSWEDVVSTPKWRNYLLRWVKAPAVNWLPGEFTDPAETGPRTSPAPRELRSPLQTQPVAGWMTRNPADPSLRGVADSIQLTFNTNSKAWLVRLIEFRAFVLRQLAEVVEDADPDTFFVNVLGVGDQVTSPIVLPDAELTPAMAGYIKRWHKQHSPPIISAVYGELGKLQENGSPEDANVPSAGCWRLVPPLFLLRATSTLTSLRVRYQCNCQGQCLCKNSRGFADGPSAQLLARLNACIYGLSARSDPRVAPALRLRAREAFDAYLTHHEEVLPQDL